MIHEENVGDTNSARFAEDVANDCPWCKGKGWVSKEGTAKFCCPCNGTGKRGGKADSISSSKWNEILRPTREEYL